MKHFILTLTIIILCLYSNTASNTSKKTNILDSNWLSLFNKQIEDIENAYTDNAFILLDDGTVLKNKTAISDYYQSFKAEHGSINNYKPIARKIVANALNIKYEIGSFATHNGKEFKHLIIYEEKEGRKLRHFEIVAQKSTVPDITDAIEQRRIDWINGANSHNVETFTENLYTPNAVYYYQSGNDLRIGRHKVTDAYQYMADPGFNITKLEAIHVEPVSSNLVFEIGTWIMPEAKGEYIIVWQLCTDKVWRILFDSNY